LTEVPIKTLGFLLVFTFCLGQYDRHQVVKDGYIPTPRAMWNLASAMVRDAEKGSEVDFKEVYNLYWITANYFYAYGEYRIEASLSDSFYGLTVIQKKVGKPFSMDKIAAVRITGDKYFGSIADARNNLIGLQKQLRRSK
jgi:hypothetical protein